MSAGAHLLVLGDAVAQSKNAIASSSAEGSPLTDDSARDIDIAACPLRARQKGNKGPPVHLNRRPSQGRKRTLTGGSSRATAVRQHLMLTVRFDAIRNRLASPPHTDTSN